MSKPTFTRKERIEHQIQKSISRILLSDLDDSRLKFLSITDVELSNDFRIAWISYSAISAIDHPRRQKTLQKLIDNAANFIRYDLAKHIKIRFVPELRFKYDKNIEYASKIDRIIKRLHDE